ncbi:RDD family protein [Streptomyces sp. URMC 125]|uniref:RDD family protein n=1 Tax=Streptomyces sp. URMC 125 TaxID=3423419 RepID=UPI003F1B1638
MSAPPSASANGSPEPGYYPDPSIPGYIRYWNGAAWVPGTSRPEPREGEPTPPAPPGVQVRQSSPPSSPLPSSPSPSPSPAPSAPRTPRESPAEETGPVFLDEEVPEGAGDAPAPSGGTLPELRGRGEVDVRPGDRVTAWDDPSRLHGVRPEPASAWQADPSRQSGPGGEREDRVSWGAPGAAPELGAGPAPRALGAAPDPHGPRGDADGGAGAPARGDGTVRMRPVRPGGTAPAAGGRPGGSGDTVGLRRPDAGAPALPAQGAPAGGPPAAHAPVPAAPNPAASVPSAPAPGAPVPNPAGPNPAAQPSWTRQVHELARRAPNTPGPNVPSPHAPVPAAHAPAVPPQQDGRPGQPGGPDRPAPWRPPVDDPFLRAAQQQARPAGLGRRLGARLVDGLVTAAVTGAVAFPFVGPSVDHFREQVEEVEQAGVTRQVWLVDGTTGGYLAIVLGAFLLFGLLYEVLPTARWGRTLGKRLFGVTVLGIEEQDTPSFGAALRRWLVYGVLSLVGIGVVNALWCLFDKPWRQCWHDKAARTFVARGSGEASLTG